MKKMFVIAAFLLASSAAQAQYSFEYDGRTIRIDPDRGTISIPGVYDNTGRKGKRSPESGGPPKQTPEQAKIDPQTPAKDPAPAPALAPAPAPAPAAQAPAPANTLPVPDLPAATASSTPSDTITSAQPSANLPPPQIQQDAAPVPRPAPPPVVATAPPAAPEPRAASPVQAANSPLGVWLTEEKEGKVRIEQCGVNLCGYSVDLKSNQNGEKVLIDMKPGKDKWGGQIHDLKSGSMYDATIALKGPDSLRVQGCAFGGMFCGGQTWSRVN
jgi:uncharacterized protein (DUF2147 family)